VIDIQEVETSARKDQNKVDSKKLEQLSSDISKILEYDFKEINRFNAKTKIQKLYDKLTLADAWLQDLGQRYNEKLNEIRNNLDPKNLDGFPFEPGDPYHRSMKEAKEALDVANLQLTLMHMFIETTMTAMETLLSIIEQTKDIEVETIKMQQEEKLIDKVFKRFEADLANRDEAFNKLVDNMDKWTLMVQQLVVIIKSILPPEELARIFSQAEKPKSEGKHESAEEQQPVPDGQITPEDQDRIKDMTNADAVRYLDKKYPHFKTVTIAKLVDCSPTQVSTYRIKKV